MAWHLYRLRLALQSPLHAGYLPIGNILKTRPYVPGKAFWGALTAALVQRTIARPQPADFEHYGEGVRASLRFGYFLPVAGEADPHRFPDTSVLGSDEFEYRFLDTYASTALDYGSRSAEQNSLHEIEVIRPVARRTRTQPEQPVFLVGYLLALESPEVVCGDCDVACQGVDLSSLIDGLQIGGKRGYGFGRVRLARWESASHLFGAELVESGLLRVPPDTPIPAHLECERSLPLTSGRVEPFVGREWRESIGCGAGQYIPAAVVSYAPGAVALAEFRTAVVDYGRWRATK